jgi:hypothetical protein
LAMSKKTNFIYIINDKYFLSVTSEPSVANYFFAVSRVLTSVPMSSPRTARSMLPSER